ncbi:hypothetical protein HGRIS_004558 [Hohenbuehelia grisea]|uniref:arginine--tRNA ligase n=1 Tax=Hohenbuehelia grisea TaxID=104357 RepID=A0ABR3JCU5_9AGAR
MCLHNNQFYIRSSSPTPSTHSNASTFVSISDDDSVTSPSTCVTFDNDALELDSKGAAFLSGEVRPLVAHRKAIASLVCSAAEGLIPLDFELVYSNIRQSKKKGCDFILPLASVIAAPRIEELAHVVNAMTQSEGDIIRLTSAVSIKDTLCFTCNTATLLTTVLTDVHSIPDYGFTDQGRGRSVIVEYSSPNIAKPFHVGHVRPTILGAFLRALFIRFGYEVIAMNYLGDWGTQFGMIAVGFDKYGSEEKLLANPCHHLYDVYVRINQDALEDTSIKPQAAAYFKRMEDGDEAALATWKHWRELSVNRYIKDYADLNAHFDIYTSESSVEREWQDQAIQTLDDMSLIQDVDGTKRVDLSEWKLGKAVLRKSNGTSIYLSRDIAEAIRRAGVHRFDKMIYVVASQQDLHLARLFRTLKSMGFNWAEQLEHVNHGLVSGMATRKGSVIFLDSVIEKLAHKIFTLMQMQSKNYANVANPEVVVRELAISTIKIHDFSRRRNKNYKFKENKVPSIKGDSGPYLHLVYARLSAICRQDDDLLAIGAQDIDVSCLANATAHRIAILLGTFPDITDRTMATYQPCTVVKYCFRLCHAIMQDIHMAGNELGSRLEERRARLWMYGGARKVLESAMSLLSLRPLEFL